MRALAVALAGLLLVTLAPSSTADHTGEIARDPAAALGLFPSPDEVQDALASAARHPWATLHDLQVSVEGRPIRVLEITNPASAVPREQRVVTLLLTQQHGNEPAGTGAAVALLEDFVAGKALAEVLDNQVLLLLPMANPDGAHADRRHNADGIDINRDHVGLDSVEARAIHEVLVRWDVHVAMDHHEYGGTGLGNPLPVRLYDYDLTTLFPRHGNVRAPTQAASEELMYDVLWPAAVEAGYTVNEYGEMTVAGVPVQELAGGPDPGILRNNLGLNHVAGLLIETRVDGHPNPFHDAQRRIDIQRLVMETTLAHASKHAQRLLEAKRASEAEAILAPASHYHEGETRAAMPAAFRTRENLDALMDMHGLPSAALDGDGWVYDLRHERQGLAAAILHPASSRAVTEAVAVPAAVEPLASTGEARVPLPLLVSLAALGLAACARRH